MQSRESICVILEDPERNKKNEIGTLVCLGMFEGLSLWTPWQDPSYPDLPRELVPGHSCQSSPRLATRSTNPPPPAIPVQELLVATLVVAAWVACAVRFVLPNLRRTEPWPEPRQEDTTLLPPSSGPAAGCVCHRRAGALAAQRQ